MGLLLLQTILDGFSWGEIAGGIVFLFILLWAWKSGVPQQLFSTTNSLLEARTTERDDALRKLESAKKEIDELKDELRILRRDNIQRADINEEDQQTIRELKKQLKALGE